jgi:hypothetical protein
VVVNPNKVQSDHPSTSQKKKDPPRKDMPERYDPKGYAPKKARDRKKDVNIKEVEKSQSPFKLESEISKIKDSIPFNDLIKNTKYRGHIMKMLKMGEIFDNLNLHDDHHTFLFGPRVEADNDNDELPPFYISLNFHDMTLHNTMLDSEASHNLMPKVVMENLGLDITRPYKDLFPFDSRKVKCLGLIKDHVITLTQIPYKSVVMDMVVDDIVD